MEQGLKFDIKEHQNSYYEGRPSDYQASRLAQNGVKNAIDDAAQQAAPNAFGDAGAAKFFTHSKPKSIGKVGMNFLLGKKMRRQQDQNGQQGHHQAAVALEAKMGRLIINQHDSPKQDKQGTSQQVGIPEKQAQQIGGLRSQPAKMRKRQSTDG
ncbi:hypothetical protein LCB40_00820 [Lactobacillus corticis]|uniref:Uncharacterized protein n=1 Tax=Lactobacillus corticis TaxID=2201249 RepID=A0A916QII4_9LACO|nr:hypothetical protein LCB40_00820 [Lactobacillus corticis]